AACAASQTVNTGDNPRRRERAQREIIQRIAQPQTRKEGRAIFVMNRQRRGLPIGSRINVVHIWQGIDQEKRAPLIAVSFSRAEDVIRTYVRLQRGRIYR